jgi:hypothetical protein
VAAGTAAGRFRVDRDDEVGRAADRGSRPLDAATPSAAASASCCFCAGCGHRRRAAARRLVDGERVVERDGGGEVRVEDCLQLRRHFGQQAFRGRAPFAVGAPSTTSACARRRALARLGAVLIEGERPRLRVDAQFRARGRCAIGPSPRASATTMSAASARAAAHPRRGLLQGARDREDAVDADHPVGHRRTHRRERCVEQFAGHDRDVGPHGLRAAAAERQTAIPASASAVAR